MPCIILLWRERAAHKNDAWHLDLVGKFRSPSLGGNHYDETSDKTVALNENDRNRITHCLLGHVSHKKMAATSAVVDGMPKNSNLILGALRATRVK